MLFWAGAGNLITGLTFAVPMPVQPMKAIAAVVLSEGMSAGEVYAAGLIMAIIMLLIWGFNITRLIEKFVPKPVVRGIQLTIGLKLLIKGVEIIYDKPITGYDSIIVGVIGFVFVLVLYNSRRIPTALILFTGGLTIAALSNNDVLNSLNVQLYIPQFIQLNVSDISGGFSKGAVPQLPLTLLNSISLSNTFLASVKPFV